MCVQGHFGGPSLIRRPGGGGWETGLEAPLPGVAMDPGPFEACHCAFRHGHDGPAASQPVDADLGEHVAAADL